jgi:hypothetical protein
VSTEADDLRNLATQIENLARAHPAYSMSWEIIRMTTSHIQCLAAFMDANRSVSLRTHYAAKSESQESPRSPLHPSPLDE